MMVMAEDASNSWRDAIALSGHFPSKVKWEMEIPSPEVRRFSGR